jgi:hypothetical protein
MFNPASEQPASIVVDLVGDQGICAVRGPYYFFGFRAATVDEVWLYRMQNQEPGRREVHDPYSSPSPAPPSPPCAYGEKR